MSVVPEVPLVSVVPEAPLVSVVPEVPLVSLVPVSLVSEELEVLRVLIVLASPIPKHSFVTRA